jgi:hypothetical protein
MRLSAQAFSYTNEGRRVNTPAFGITESASGLLWRAERSSLYTLCCLDGTTADDLAAVVTEAMHVEHARSSKRTVTSRLLRSIRAGLDALQAENERSLLQHRCGGALVASTVKGSGVYLGFAGGASVFALQDGELRRLGAPVPEYRDDVDCECEVGLASVTLGDSDVLLMASPALHLLASDAELRELLVRDGPAGLYDLIERRLSSLPDDTTLSLMVLSQEGAAASGQPDKPKAVSVDTLPIVATVAPDHRPDRAAAIASTKPRAPSIGASSTAPSTEPSLRAASPSATMVLEREVEPPARATNVAHQAGVLTTLKATLGPSIVRVLFRFSVAAIIIAVLAVALYLGEQVWKSHNDQAKVQEMLTLVEQKERDALAASDPATRRWLLTDASRLADQALSTRSKDPSLTEAANRINGLLDEANNIVRLPGLQLLADFATIDRSSQPVSLAVNDNDIYVLDQGTGAVWNLSLGRDLGALGAPKRLWQKAAVAGEVSLGDGIAVLWMHGGAPGVPEQAYALEVGGHLVRCDGDQVSNPMKLPAAGALSHVRAAAGQAGNLYVLDGQRRLIWRYVPGAAGYDGAPQEYLTEKMAPGLDQAVDMAMDGSLYVLLSTGQINKYTTGRAQPFPAVLPDSELRRPSSIFASPQARSIYVADTGNARVVEFTKDGQYVRQFRAPNDGFDGIRSVHADEERGLLYTLVGARLFVSQIPKLAAQ